MSKLNSLLIASLALLALNFTTGCGTPLSPDNIWNNETGKEEDLKSQADQVFDQLNDQYAINLDFHDGSDITEAGRLSNYLLGQNNWVSSATSRDSVRSLLNQFVDVSGQILDKISSHKVFDSDGDFSTYTTRQSNAKAYLSDLNAYEKK